MARLPAPRPSLVRGSRAAAAAAAAALLRAALPLGAAASSGGGGTLGAAAGPSHLPESLYSRGSGACSGLDVSGLVQLALGVSRAGSSARQTSEGEQHAGQLQLNGITEGPLLPLSVDPEVLEAAGLARNAAGDLPVFLSAVITNTLVALACGAAFSVLRRWFPQMYANNVRTKQEGGLETAPFKPADSLLGWIPAGLFVTVEQAMATSGADAAMLLEFTGFCMKLLGVIGVPLLVVLSPLHYWCGGGVMKKIGDRLGTIGLNNVEKGSWLFLFHSFVVWYVVLATEHMVFVSMRRFLKLRFEWLEKLKLPRSTTVMVEGLPESLRSDEALAKHFGKFFPHEAVESACVVKNTQHLEATVAVLKDKKLALEKALFQRRKRDEVGHKDEALGGRDLNAEIRDLEAEVASLEQEARRERDRILADASLPFDEQDDGEAEGGKVLVLNPRAGAVCSHCGFVTFTGEREAMLVMSARCSADTDEMVLSIPPEPMDIRYNDLQMSQAMERVLAVLGYAAIFGIFCSYMPFIVAISTLTRLEQLEKIHFFHMLKVHAPTFATLLQGFFSTLGIVLFMSFLPTILMKIFNGCFRLKANAWAQLRLQVWYFWFLVVFVLLITAIGASLLSRIMYLVKHPTAVSGILADSLPTATHFYLNYVVMQWVVHAMNLTRYIQLIKFFIYRATLGEQRAVELAEPEDQEYYGVGARSARWSLDIVLALVFCSITPLITLVTFVNFLITRVVYGYLIVFAETRKHDLGGPFFVEQMKSVQFAVLLYILLMMGVFARRAATWLPVAVAGVALLRVLYGFKRFYALAWEFLPLDVVISDKFQEGSQEEMARYRALGKKRPRYVQPELCEETWRAGAGEEQ